MMNVRVAYRIDSKLISPAAEAYKDETSTIMSTPEKRYTEINLGGCQYTFDRDAFRKASYLEQKTIDSLLRFESRMASVSHVVCSECNQCTISESMNLRKRDNVCARCRRKDNNGAYSQKNLMIPSWKDAEGTEHFDVPEELRDLTIAEVLLIQRVAPLVPLAHIRNGTMGLRGHVCSFMQNISSVATTLPRLPRNIRAVKFVRTFVDATGSKKTRVYMVNKSRVIRALRWLVAHHVEYRLAHESGELTIELSNLDWMGEEEEMELPSVATLEREFETAEEADGERTSGVSESQCVEPLEQDNDALECSGMTCPPDASLTSEAEDAMMRALKETPKGRQIPVLDWPQQSSEAISEYEDSVKIFVNAFPHLFPGGVADINERNRQTEISITDWAKHLIYQSDGRFASDPIFPFFVYNFAQRRRNISNGSFFVKSHISDAPKSVDELKEQLEKGDASFINKISYFSRKQRGTDGFWRQKRAELYNWIHYHVSKGNGMPNIFMTLSCAEYFWPDIIRLLEERVWIAEGKMINEEGEKCHRNGKTINFAQNRAARNRAVNDHALVVQEFFIMRTEDFLETVGREVLGIKHYWVRFEFAKGRGQIHAHLLAILKKEIMSSLQKQLDVKDITPELEARIVSDWAKQMFGMTADIDAEVQEKRGKNPNSSSSSLRLGEVQDYRLDEVNLCQECQIHKCSSYCMRNQKGKQKGKKKTERNRFCRAGRCPSSQPRRPGPSAYRRPPCPSSPCSS